MLVIEILTGWMIKEGRKKMFTKKELNTMRKKGMYRERYIIDTYDYVTVYVSGNHFIAKFINESEQIFACYCLDLERWI